MFNEEETAVFQKSPIKANKVQKEISVDFFTASGLHVDEDGSSDNIFKSSSEEELVCIETKGISVKAKPSKHKGLQKVRNS